MDNLKEMHLNKDGGNFINCLFFDSCIMYTRICEVNLLINA